MRTSSFDIALALVKKEDDEAKAERIRKYKQEIDGALKIIQRAKKQRLKTVTISPDQESEGRVRSALLLLGYTCSESTTRKGDWTNGVGYAHYRAFEVSWSNQVLEPAS